MDEDYIDTYAAAEELGMSRATLWKLIKDRGIKRYRMPGNVRTLIRRSDLTALRQPILLDESTPRRGRPRGTSQGKWKAAA